MPALYLLGTGASISDPHRTTTMLAFEGDRSIIVVDCGGDVVQRLLQAALPLDNIEALIVTHEHADHIGGFPLFMQKIWIAGRRRPIPIYGPRKTIDLAKRLFESFNTEGWEGMPEAQYHEVPLEEGAVVLEDEQWRITASPGKHSVPVMGLRVEDRKGGGTVAYSCDTEPNGSITTLSRNVDILLHEASGDYSGHTGAEDAARVAAAAGVDRLLLVHLPPSAKLSPELMERAREQFPAVEKGEELGRYTF